MISFLILPMQRVTRLPLLLDVSKSEVAAPGTSCCSEPSSDLPGGRCYLGSSGAGPGGCLGHEVMVTDVAAVRALPGAGFAATSTVQSCFERALSCPVLAPCQVRAGIASAKPRGPSVRSCSALQCH